MKTFKIILSAILVMLLMLHTNYVLVYYSMYEINVEQLTQSCCEKKVDNCNAHCYLEKKIHENTDNSGKGNNSDIKLKLSEYIIRTATGLKHPEKFTSYTLHNSNGISNEFSSKIKHPPRS